MPELDETPKQFKNTYFEGLQKERKTNLQIHHTQTEELPTTKQISDFTKDKLQNLYSEIIDDYNVKTSELERKGRFETEQTMNLEFKTLGG